MMKQAWVWASMILGVVLAAATASADTVSGPALVVTDTPTDFRAIGSLTTVDDSNPVNGVGGNFLKVESAANPNWSFEIGHITGAPHYNLKANGKWEFTNVGIQIQGGRVNNIGHIATPHAGEAQNAIPLATTARRRGIEMGDGGRGMSAGGFVGHGQHIDTYRLEARVTAVQGNPNPGNAAPGPPNLLTGGFEVVAQHQAIGGGSSKSSGGSFYSDPNGGTWVSYDSRSGELTLHIGKINGLDFKGGGAGGVQSEFSNDPMLGAQWTVSNLKFKGMNDGVANFGGGEVEVTDPDDRFSLYGKFDKFTIGSSMSFPELKSFGILSHWEIDRALDSACASPFLDRFVEYNLMGHGMSADDWRAWNGIDLAVVTKKDLALATDNFKSSASKIPATIYLTLNLKPQEEVAKEEQAQTPPATQATPKPEAAAQKTEGKPVEDFAKKATDFLEKTFPGLKKEE